MGKLIYKTDKDIIIKDYVKLNISKKFYRFLKRQNVKYYINNEEANNYECLKKGDVLSILYDDEVSVNELFCYEIEVLYEDSDLLVINKPSGLKTIPTGYNDFESLYNAILYYYKMNNIEGSVHFINRLDKDTSGLLLVCKNKISANIMSKRIDNINRCYLALCYNKFEVNSGVINLPIKKDNDNIKRIIDDSGKESITNYEVVKEFDNYSLVRVSLETGRTHQIRLHMSYIGHPLLGDSIYGILDEYTLRLHSYKISFKNIKNEEINIVNYPEWCDYTEEKK